MLFRSQQIENDAVLAQIRAIDAEIVDVKDLNKVKAGLLVRKQIVEQLHAYAWRGEAALHVFGHLPDGVQVLGLELDEDHATFDLRATATGELGVLELLTRDQLDSLRVTAAHDQDDASKRVTIKARPARRGEE